MDSSEASVKVRTPTLRGWRWSLTCVFWATWVVGVGAFLYYGFSMPSSWRLAVVAWMYVGACAALAAHPRARRATWAWCAILGLGYAFVGGIGVGFALAGEVDPWSWPIPAGFTLTLVPIWVTLWGKDVAESK